jgi:eukaryotic-like serine/threonine-protein kinase
MQVIFVPRGLMSMIGKTLAHYEITSQLGKGGMGEVYQAKDQKLGRDVAIKILPEEFARDADRVARFQREAKLLASLNHPSIAAIYGLEESGGTSFLVLELIGGETLADHLKRGPVPIEESLKLALQIAEALEAAHEKGIIHRDLKPSNIKVTPEGKVKVLDFGLAKAFAGEQEDQNLSKSPTLTYSPTLSDAATRQGVILGTAAYMPPEQARGESVDKRADIWAFGCVLFEMLTGRGMFEGRTVSDVLASVIKSEPEWKRLPPNLHPRIRLLLERCLEKEPKDRYGSINDARVDIQRVLADPGGVFVQPSTAVAPGTKLRMMLPWLAAAVVLTAIIAGLAVWMLKPREPRPIARFSCILPADQTLITGNFQVVAISPDGSRFVCATNKGLYLRSMDQLQGGIIPGTEGGQLSTPFFSPDGQWVGFWSERDKQLKRIPIIGGGPVTICDAQWCTYVRWSADNVILFDEFQKKRIMRVSADGGIAEKILESKNDMLFAPRLLPDGTNLLLSFSPSNQTNDVRIAVQSFPSGTRKELFAGMGARYLDTGHLVYVRGGDLFAVPFDAGRLEVTGSHVSMAQGIAGVPPKYAVSDSGTLVYVQGAEAPPTERILVWVDRNGKEEAIDAPPRAYTYAHLSPDGTRVALDIRDQQNDIWIWDLARRTLTRLTFDPGMNRGGIWTPDGKSVAFSAERNGDENIWLQSADGSGSAEQLTQIPKAALIPESFSPDGKQLLIGNITNPRSAGLVSIGGGAAPKQLLASEFTKKNFKISPDGRWMAYESNESGRSEIYVRPFPSVDAGGRWQISTEGGTRPLWNHNGREVFYYLPPGIMMSVPVETGASFKAGTPRVLFKGEYLATPDRTQYSVTPDGRRFLMIKNAAAKPGGAAPPQQINVVLNWTEELKQRVRVK